SSCAQFAPMIPEKGGQEKMPAFLESHGLMRFESSRPTIYFSGEEWKRRALDLIRGAKDYILLSSFITNVSDANEEVFDALVKKADSGVRVYIMFDSCSYFAFTTKKNPHMPVAIKAFEGKTVHVTEYNPISGEKLFAAPFLLNRDHRKFWIVDGQYMATGGMNLDYHSLSPQGENGNIDTFVEIESSGATKQMIRSFCEAWNRYSVETISEDSFAVADGAADVRLWLADQTLEGDSLMDPMFDAFFLYAQKEIWMIQAYTFSTPKLVAKIKAATQRGVRVNIMQSDNAITAAYDKSAKYCIKDLMDAGANVFIFNSPDKAFLHYKLMLADGKVAAFGSPNYNFRSQYLSRELAFVFDDEETGAIAYRNVEQLAAYARPVTREEALRYRGLDYWFSYISMLFGG
ncbi:MAG TPA: phosphatidylserine/phosphatidylglycerophosphate/cardiolipin synthase family protein, partial [Rectinemataceae bacterium]|nr:phosphatidylserine/phosphatidylglycerophosphate/cardiolipin synthase family protein [Rectinemataceae bacterium]